MSSISEVHVDSIDVVSSLDSISCRVCCVQFGAFLTLDSELDEGRKLLELFNEFTLLQAAFNDQLPQILCQSCVDDLNLVEIFIKKARTADQQYRERITTQAAPAAEKEFAFRCQKDNFFKQRDDDANDSIKTEQSFVDINFDDEIEVLIEDHEALSDCENNDLHLNETSGMDKEPFRSSSRIVRRNPTGFVERKILTMNACELCGERFTSKQKLQQHGLVHMKTKEFKCTICPKKLATLHHKRIHLQRHSADHSFVCQECNKILGSRQGLHRHRKLHTGERPYICDVCGRSFTQRSVLKTHQALHVGKQNKCPHCPKMFSRPSQLIVHKRAHTGERPYKCNDCDSTYTQKSHLDRHVGTHLGLRFKCARCDKSYSKKSTLKSHIVQDHEVPHEYKCNQCSKTFNKKKTFQYHMKTKHNSKEDLPPDV